MKAFEEFTGRKIAAGIKSERVIHLEKPREAKVWRAAILWARLVIAEQLKSHVNFDDNIACVQSIDQAFQAELDMCQKVDKGDGDGFRFVCKSFSQDQQKLCQEETRENHE